MKNETFASLTFRKKLGWLWDYYKLQILVGAFLLIALLSILVSAVTKPKAILSVGLVNVTLSEESQTPLKENYLNRPDAKQKPKKRDTVALDSFLLTGKNTPVDYEYAYASQMKLMAQITAQKLDVVILDDTARNEMEQKGYLLKLPAKLQGKGATGTRASDESAPSHTAGASDDYTLSLAGTSFVKAAGLKGNLYVGVISNTMRRSEALSYVKYLYDAKNRV